MNTRTTSEGGEGLDRLFRFLPDAGLWLDTNGRVMAANAVAEQLFNAPEEVIAGKHLAELWEEDDGFALAAMVKRGQRGDPSTVFHARTSSGRLCVLSPRILHGLRVDATLLVLADATAMDRAADRVRHMRAAIDVAQEGVAVVDMRDGEPALQWANPSFFVLLGYTEAQEVIGPHIVEQLDAVMACVNPQRLPEGGRDSGRCELVRLDGYRVTVNWTVAPIRESELDPEARLWALTVEDTTVQDRIDRMVEEQQAVNRDARDMASLGDMVAGIAHDFNNALTVIRNLALLSADESDIGRVRQDLDSISQATEDAAELARSLTAFGRRGAHQDREEIFDFDDTIRQIVQVVGRGLHMKLDIQTDLACDARVRSRPGMLQQVLYNLMINAGDAAEGRGKLTIKTRLLNDPLGEVVELEVADDGVGMVDAVREQAFLPYFTTKGSAGTGLGLAKVHYLLQQNRGSIDVASAPGAGTCFTIRLPVEPRPLLAPPEANGTALLVDDDPAIRTLLVKMLRRRDISCVAVASGAEAESLEVQAPPEFVIVDLVIGEEDGREVAQTLRSRWPQAHYALTTGAHLPDSSEPPAPFDYVLAKPFGSADVNAFLSYFEDPAAVD
ncbi:MAG: ATP-binding protein [Pseudomonadota bacterium]|nr:ATP-binding protein [Pseudomonadota bacterium]